jgi:hypothetical protein
MLIGSNKYKYFLKGRPISWISYLFVLLSAGEHYNIIRETGYFRVVCCVHANHPHLSGCLHKHGNQMAYELEWMDVDVCVLKGWAWLSAVSSLSNELFCLHEIWISQAPLPLFVFKRPINSRERQTEARLMHHHHNKSFLLPFPSNTSCSCTIIIFLPSVCSTQIRPGMTPLLAYLSYIAT